MHQPLPSWHAALLLLAGLTGRDAHSDDGRVGVHSAHATVKGHAHAEQAQGVEQHGDNDGTLGHDGLHALLAQLSGQPGDGAVEGAGDPAVHMCGAKRGGGTSGHALLLWGLRGGLTLHGWQQLSKLLTSRAGPAAMPTKHACARQLTMP